MNKKNIKQQLIKIHADEAIHHIDKIKHSFRWKLGDRVARIIESILFIKRPKLSIEYLEEHLRIIKQLSSSETELPSTSFVGISLANISRILFLVSDSNIETSVYGDTHVAYDFKKGLEGAFEHIVCDLINHKDKITSDNWDIIIAMLWDTELQKKQNNKGLNIAWIRNYPDRWVANPYFLNYDLLLCSSMKILNYVKKHSETPAYLFPIAANTSKFPIQNDLPKNRSICFVGNKWKEERQIEKIIKKKLFDFQVYGQGWKRSEFGDIIKGKISNSSIPSAYKNSYIILDSANATTTEWESLNSRIYNAIASKRLIITDSEKAASLFKYPIPTYRDALDLAAKLNHYIANIQDYKKDIEALLKELNLKHTYQHRAVSFQFIIEQKINIAIKIAPTEEQKQSFGDWYFAEDLKKALEVYHHKVRIDCYDNWYNENAYQDDLVIVLRGLKKYKPIHHQVNFMWLISHPNEVTVEEMTIYNFSFLASYHHVEQLKREGLSQISVLHQCTNEKKFLNVKKSFPKKKVLLFVGNSRNVYRKSVKYAIELGLDIHVYGNDWGQFIPTKYIKANFISNEKLYQLYNEYDIVLNDHWDDMIEYGYLSNRVFDASAAGAQILSDLPMACEDLISGIHYYHDKMSFLQKIKEIRRLSSKTQDNYYEVINRHTFGERVKTILGQYYTISYEKVV